MRYTIVTEVSRQDELDAAERVVRFHLERKNGCLAKQMWDELTEDWTPEEESEVWFRFAANERSAMKERREVRPPRSSPKTQKKQDNETGK